MTRVGGIGGGAAPARRIGRGAGGFTVPDAADGTAAASLSPVAGPALLALQEGPAPAAAAEQRARRRGQAALDLLREVQLDLLRGGTAPARLARLAETAAAAAEAPPGDPALRAALAEVALRVRVELARRRAGRATAG